LTASGTGPSMLAQSKGVAARSPPMSEFHDEYSEALDGEFRKLEDALLSDRVRLLAPSEPLRLSPDATVAEAVSRMVEHRRAAVVVVDGAGRLIGIVTERDLLTRVMTPDPEALAPDDRICYAINRMHAGGYRIVPLVDEERRPIGIVTVNDVAGWLAGIFPE